MCFKEFYFWHDVMESIHKRLFSGQLFDLLMKFSSRITSLWKIDHIYALELCAEV